MPNDKVQDNVETERPQPNAAANIELPAEITGPSQERAQSDRAESKDSGDKSNAGAQPSAGLWKALSGAGNQLVEAAKGSLPELSIAGLGDSAAAEKAKAAKEDNAVKNLAEAGRKNGDEAIDRYFSFRDSKDGNTIGGANKDAAQGLNGDDTAKEKPLTSLSVPGKDKPYEAKYNDKNEIVQLKSPNGLTFNRVSPANDNGFAFWQASNEKGQIVPFGSNSNSFVGKLSLDKEGSHIMIGHDKRNPRNDTKHAGTLIETKADGSESRSSVLSENGKTAGIETRLTQRDGTVVRSMAQYDKAGKLNRNDSVSVDSKDGDSKYVVKNGEITSRDTNILAKQNARDFARSLDSNAKLSNLRHADVTTMNNGSLHLNITNDRATFQSSVNPGTVISGTRVDGSTMSNHISMNAKFQNGAIELNNVRGITGHGAKQGPLGLRWWSGSAVVDSVKIEGGVMHTHTNRGWSSTSQHLMKAEAQGTVDAANVKQSGEMLKAVAENTKNLQVDRVGAREFKVSMKPTEHLKKQVEKDGFLKLGDNVNIKASYNETGVKMDVKGIKTFGMDVTEIKSQPGKGGKMEYKASYTNPLTGEKGSYPISEDQIRKMTKSFGL